MSGGPLRALGFANLVSRKDSPGKIRRAARGSVTGKKQEIRNLDADSRITDNEAKVAALEAEVATLKAAFAAAGFTL